METMISVWIIRLLDFCMELFDEEENQERYGTCMETMILVWIIGLLDFCMELFDEEETINPFFFYEFGFKRTLLGILVVFWIWVG